MSVLVLALPGNERGAAVLAGHLGATWSLVQVHRFPDGECSVRIDADPAGREVALFASLDAPDGKLAPLMFSAALARDLGARRVGLVAPYLAYLRQDMRFHPGESVTARYFAALLSGNVDWLATVDPHLHRIARLADAYAIPAVAASSAPSIGRWVAANVTRPVIVGPDEESRQWVSAVAREAGAPYVVMAKARHGDRDVRVRPPEAALPAGATPVVVDDIASTGHTLATCVAALGGSPARPVRCAVVHAVFAPGAAETLAAAGAAVVSTGTVPHASNAIEIDEALAAAVASAMGT